MRRKGKFSGLALAFLLAIAPAAARGLELKPYKDRLFNYPATLAEEMGGRYRILDYQERRDIHARDEIVEKRVRQEYVSLRVRRSEKEQRAELPGGGELRWIAVGNRHSPSVITLYLHGQGGNRKQGVNDFTFGGNFNRLKNLMAENGGLYLSPDVPSFDVSGAHAISSLVAYFHGVAPSAPIFIACGSMGAFICYHLARDPQLVKTVKGYVLLGAPADPKWFDTPAFRQRTPVFLGHGSRDTVYPIAATKAFLQQFETRSPGYPVRLFRFEGGSHGTPIRMVDWRDTLNWMLRVNADRD